MKQYKGLYIPPLVEKERVTCVELSTNVCSDIGCWDVRLCSECIASPDNSKVLNEWLEATSPRKPRTTNKRLLPQARMRGNR